MSVHFPKPKSLGANVKVELDLSDYATKVNLERAKCIDTLDFDRKYDVPSVVKFRICDKLFIQTHLLRH